MYVDLITIRTPFGAQAFAAPAYSGIHEGDAAKYETDQGERIGLVESVCTLDEKAPIYLAVQRLCPDDFPLRKITAFGQLKPVDWVGWEAVKNVG